MATETMAPLHTDGRFQNPWGTNNSKTFWSVLKWKFSTTPEKWPEQVHFDPQELPATPKTGALITWVNHATWLIQLPTMNILVDPVWSKRASPFSFAGPKRVHEPGIPWDKLPKIDLVLVSHNHYDHLDIATLEALEKRDHPQFLVPLGDLDLLKSKGISRIAELTWWQEFKMGTTVVTFTPAQHWSARWTWDRNKSLWGGWWIQEGQTSLFHAGDTGHGPHFKVIREKLGTPTMAMIPIGAYEPRWFMKAMHMNPADAVESVKDLGLPKLSVAMHFGTFQLTDEGHDQPMIDLKKAIESAKLESQFKVPKVGETFVSD